MKLAHITSVHLPGLWRTRMDYLNSLRPDVVNVLALCGERFRKGIDDVDYEPKFYAPGRRCYRAREFFYGFLDLGIDADYLMYTDYDHLILRKDYVEVLMDRIGDAAVFGRGMQNMMGRQGGQMRKLPSNYVEWLKSFTVRKRPGVYCCLGTGEVLRTDFLREWRAMGEKIHATSEIHVPTVAYNLGYEVKTDVGVFKHVSAGTKKVGVDRVKKVMGMGGVSIHPFKDLQNTKRVYDMIRRYNDVG